MAAPYKILFVGIGHPINKSLGPVIHNAGLKAKGLDDKFLYVSLDVQPDMLVQFLDLAKTANIGGITVTLPHKEAVIPLLDNVDETADQIGAVNTIVNNDGILTGYNTDYIGAVEPLKAMTEIKGKKTAVIGAGGAAKAFAFGLIGESADVTIFNRTLEKAEVLAQKYGCKAAGLDEIEQIRDFDIICNASSVGFAGSGQSNSSPVTDNLLNADQIVFDAVYSPVKTKLLETAENAGAQTIAGTEMLLCQGYAQFEHYYQMAAPKAEMKSALMEYLSND